MPTSSLCAYLAGGFEWGRRPASSDASVSPQEL